jgi:hypothetical protein
MCFIDICVLFVQKSLRAEIHANIAKYKGQARLIVQVFSNHYFKKPWSVFLFFNG